MNNLKFFLTFFMPLTLCACSNDSNSQSAMSGNHQELSAQRDIVNEETESETVMEPNLPIQFQALFLSYPDNIKGLEGNEVVLASGEKVIFDDGKNKDFMGRLDDSDIEDMFYDVYALPDPEPAFQFDPGRSRSEALYKAMYGKSAAEVQRKLVPVDWFGQKVQFMSVNGAADSLKAVAKEIALYPELKPYLKSSGTFYWRPVRGAKRMSAHSYGIAFDIGVDKSDYWQWKSGTNNENAKVKYSNRIPRQIVEIFQKHGFIWGGAWYHYDTMHFEFRPELLKYAEIVNTRGN